MSDATCSRRVEDGGGRKPTPRNTRDCQPHRITHSPIPRPATTISVLRVSEDATATGAHQHHPKLRGGRSVLSSKRNERLPAPTGAESSAYTNFKEVRIELEMAVVDEHMTHAIP